MTDLAKVTFSSEYFMMRDHYVKDMMWLWTSLWILNNTSYRKLPLRNRTSRLIACGICLDQISFVLQKAVLFGWKSITTAIAWLFVFILMTLLHVRWTRNRRKQARLRERSIKWGFNKSQELLMRISGDVKLVAEIHSPGCFNLWSVY